MSMHDDVETRFSVDIFLHSPIIPVKAVCICFSILISSFFPFFSSLIGSWVVVGMNARLRTKAETFNLSFDQQCKHCEKVIFFNGF